MRALKEIYRAQALVFFRDGTALVVTLLLPVLLAAFFSTIFKDAGQTKLRFALVDQENSRVSTALAKGLKRSSKHISLTTRASVSNAVQQLRAGGNDLVIVIPKGSDERLLGRRSPIKLYFDPNRAESAGVAVQSVRLAISEANLAMSGAPPVLSTTGTSALPRQKSLAEFYLPNFLALSILWLGLFATTMPIVQQRQDQALFRMGATPLSPAVLMGGMTLWRLTLGLCQAALFLAIGRLLMGVSMMQRPGMLVAGLLLGNLAFVVLGYVVAAVSKTTESAGTLVQAVNFPMMFLSGIFFTSDMLPPIVQKIAYVIPLSYLADSLRQTMVGYPGMFPLWLDFSVLAGFILVCTLLAQRVWRWQ